MRVVRKAIGSAIFASAFAVATPASATIIEFYEGNNCTQKKLGGANLRVHLDNDADRVVILSRNIVRAIGIPISNANPWNDEARSARITTNWRAVREPRGISVTIYDSPDAKKNDDWARIVIRDATLIPPEGVCIGSFERNFDRNGVYLERYPHNGLDGKISYIQSNCDAACRANLTPDPSPPARPKLVVKPTPTPAPTPKLVVKHAPPKPKLIVKPSPTPTPTPSPKRAIQRSK